MENKIQRYGEMMDEWSMHFHTSYGKIHMVYAFFGKSRFANILQVYFQGAGAI